MGRIIHQIIHKIGSSQEKARKSSLDATIRTLKNVGEPIDTVWAFRIIDVPFRTELFISAGNLIEFESLSQKFKEAEEKKDAVSRQISDIRDRRDTMEDFLRILKQQDGEVTAFSEKLWCGLLDYATAYADGRLTFTFKNGSTFEG